MNDIIFAINNLENARINLSVQSGETNDFWLDSMKYAFYNNVIDHYNPTTINYIAKFEEALRHLDHIIHQLESFQDDEYGNKN